MTKRLGFFKKILEEAQKSGYIDASANKHKSQIAKITKTLLRTRKSVRQTLTANTSVVFYSQTACDKMDLKDTKIVALDAGFKTPSVMRKIKTLPYTRPKSNDGFSENQDMFMLNIWTVTFQNQILKYETTNRSGYREYESNPTICSACPYRRCVL